MWRAETRRVIKALCGSSCHHWRCTLTRLFRKCPRWLMRASGKRSQVAAENGSRFGNPTLVRETKQDLGATRGRVNFQKKLLTKLLPRRFIATRQPRSNYKGAAAHHRHRTMIGTMQWPFCLGESHLYPNLGSRQGPSVPTDSLKSTPRAASWKAAPLAPRGRPSRRGDIGAEASAPAEART
jgi:hypothetical protein